jgi:signal transduction histidine kinase
VSIRAKLLLVFMVLGIVPMLLLSAGYYRSGARAVEGLLRAEVTSRAADAAHHLTTQLAEREADLRELARNPALRAYLRAQPTPAQPPAADPARALTAVATAALPDDVRATLEAFLQRRPEQFTSVTVVGADGHALVQVDAQRGANGPITFTPGQMLYGKVKLDERVWAAGDPNTARPLRAPLSHVARGSNLRYTVPVWASATASASPPSGALVVELHLDPLFDQLEAGAASDRTAQRTQAEPQRLLLVMERSGQLLYHTNPAHAYWPVVEVMPGFDEITRAITTGGHGADFYTAQDGTRWLAAYQPVTPELSVAAAANVTSAGAGLQRLGMLGLALAILTTLATAIILAVVVERAARRINRVAEAAAEIAHGNIEQRINVQSADETRLLAESFNLMSDRLREHIAREAESKQFQSFLRISAMLTHDLKNAITGLNMLVNNMERQFHRAEFRADAISSLRAATDKLRALVARLHEPTLTLSGEYRQAIRPTDLVALIERVLTTTAQPAAMFHQIERQLPATLVAAVDADRIERVLENLVLNALDAMRGQSGRLTVEAGAEGEQQVFISVRDTGLGMPEEFIRTRLFRPFATTKEKGIGLGLYTCREIVAAHGGRIDVESKVGVGTCFRVVLPSTPVTRASQISAARSRQTTDAKATRPVDQVPQ